ncbi:hypothetical protein [Priestia megaterium]|uniref:hypothetical protein n=1 Tax=Priestia megaterium TaxID=1404 RepID=UPI003CC69223
MELRDEYGNYTHVKCLRTVDVDGKRLWTEGKTYKVKEVWRADRLVDIESEYDGNKAMIELDSEDFDFIEEEDD